MEHLRMSGQSSRKNHGGCRVVHNAAAGNVQRDKSSFHIHRCVSPEHYHAVPKNSLAAHYVMADDKLRILAAMKTIWRERLTTVFPRQGHYALDPKAIATYPPADITVERIGDLVNCDLPAFLGTDKGAHEIGGKANTPSTANKRG